MYHCCSCIYIIKYDLRVSKDSISLSRGRNTPGILILTGELFFNVISLRVNIFLKIFCFRVPIMKFNVIKIGALFENFQTLVVGYLCLKHNIMWTQLLEKICSWSCIILFIIFCALCITCTLIIYYTFFMCVRFSAYYIITSLFLRTLIWYFKIKIICYSYEW